MALIICPECGKSISDKSEACIYCGFPVAAEEKKKVQITKQQQEQDWQSRNQTALKLAAEDGIPLFIELGDEGYLYGYLNAGISYDNLGNETRAYEYWMKAYRIDPKCCNGEVAEQLGYLCARKNSPFFDEDKAIRYLKECGTLGSNRPLGQIYDPCHKQNGFQKYKDASAALACYKKLLLDNKYPYMATVYNDMGVLYGDVYNNFVVAACYCLLANRISSNQTRSNNYQTYLALALKKGEIWRANIESIRTHEDIDPMIDRVNAQIRALQTPVNSNSPKARCPTCGSDKIEKISSLDRVVSTYMWGFFSKKIGKQFKCRNCGYLW